MKKLVSIIAGLALAACALAELAKYKDWDKSPDAYFLTPPERADWKKVASDADAETFIAIYWAKRGGEPFRQEISRRIYFRYRIFGRRSSETAMPDADVLALRDTSPSR